MPQFNVKLVEALNNELLSEVKDLIADELEDSTVKRIEAGAFKPLKYPNRPFPHKPLNLTGRLKRSISAYYDDKGVYVEAKVSYASFHQFGTTKIPQRKFVYLDMKDREAIINIWKRFEVK